MSPSDCLFCKIVAGTVPATKVAEDERFVAFRDINPQAPTHILVIPREHAASLADADDERMLGGLLQFARAVAESEGALERGFRVVINTNADAQQTVFHLHAHVLAGRKFTWPPG